MSVEIMAMSPLKQIMKGSSANSSTAENLLLVETNPSSPTSKNFITLSCTFCCDCRIISQRLSPGAKPMVELKGLHCTSGSGLSGGHAFLYEQSQETKKVQKVNL